MTKNDIAKMIIKRMNDLHILVSEKQVISEIKRTSKKECEMALNEIWPNWREEAV